MCMQVGSSNTKLLINPAPSEYWFADLYPKRNHPFRVLVGKCFEESLSGKLLKHFQIMDGNWLDDHLLLHVK